MSIDRPDLHRLLDYMAAHRVGFCLVATRDRLSEDPEHMADIDQGLDDMLVAIVVATDHIKPDTKQLQAQRAPFRASRLCAEALGPTDLEPGCRADPA
jgi:DNA invertase Pin-like site-specific DNA recombinase